MFTHSGNRLVVALGLGLLFLLTAAWQPSASAGTSDKTERVNPKLVHPNTIQHAKLTPGQTKRLKRVYGIFHNVDPMPYAKWDEDFRRDQDPDREIRIYEGMADAYTAYCAHKKLTLAAKKEVYAVLLMRSGAPDTVVLSRVHPKILTGADVREVLRLCKAAPMPVEIAPGR